MYRYPGASQFAHQPRGLEISPTPFSIHVLGRVPIIAYGGYGPRPASKTDQIFASKISSKIFASKIFVRSQRPRGRANHHHAMAEKFSM